MSRQGVSEDERGFTLIEVIVAIILMGIVFAIASASWFGVAESRRVDSATNQVAADLRLAHTRATNRLENWEIDLRPTGEPTTNYRMGPCVDPCTTSLPPPEEGSEFPAEMSSVRVVFKPNGEAETFDLDSIRELPYEP